MFGLDFTTLTNSDWFICTCAGIGPIGGLVLFRLQRFLWPKPVAERARLAGGSLFLNEMIKDYGYWWLHWQARFLVYLRVHPTTITLGGMLVVWTAAGFVANGCLAFGGLWILLGSLSDMLDGMVARERNLITRGGTYIDSMVDRYSDLGLFGGLLIYMRDRPSICAWILLAAVGAAMVSYARAKAEALGVRNVPKGMMQRAERAVYLGFATFFSPLAIRHCNAPGDQTPWLAVGICVVIAVLANFSAVRMSLYTIAALNAPDFEPTPPSRGEQSSDAPAALRAAAQPHA